MSFPFLATRRAQPSQSTRPVERAVGAAVGSVMGRGNFLYVAARTRKMPSFFMTPITEKPSP